MGRKKSVVSAEDDKDVTRLLIEAKNALTQIVEDELDTREAFNQASRTPALVAKWKNEVETGIERGSIAGGDQAKLWRSACRNPPVLGSMNVVVQFGVSLFAETRVRDSGAYHERTKQTRIGMADLMAAWMAPRREALSLKHIYSSMDDITSVVDAFNKVEMTPHALYGQVFAGNYPLRGLVERAEELKEMIRIDSERQEIAPIPLVLFVEREALYEAVSNRHWAVLINVDDYLYNINSGILK